MLKITGDGRRAALDLRLVDAGDDPDGGKLTVAARRIASIHHDTAVPRLDQSGLWIRWRSTSDLQDCWRRRPTGRLTNQACE